MSRTDSSPADTITPNPTNTNPDVLSPTTNTTTNNTMKKKRTRLPRSKPFSLIRMFTLADFITLGNATCGCASIFLCLNALSTNTHEMIWVAMLLLPLGLFLDIMDGHVARWRHSHSPLGADLDSLADIISFGVAPAVVGFTLGMTGIWDAIALIFFVLCGLSRLARYNITHDELAGGADKKVPYYEGFPIPSSIFIVAILAYAYKRGWVGSENMMLGRYIVLGYTFHPFVLIYVLIGFAMASKNLKIPKP